MCDVHWPPVRKSRGFCVKLLGRLVFCGWRSLRLLRFDPAPDNLALDQVTNHGTDRFPRHATEFYRDFRSVKIRLVSRRDVNRLFEWVWRFWHRVFGWFACRLWVVYPRNQIGRIILGFRAIVCKRLSDNDFYSVRSEKRQRKVLKCAF